MQPDWTNDYTYPAQYWSGRSQNGTVFMLVRSTPSSFLACSTLTLAVYCRAAPRPQLNVLDEPADMTFSLTESPWVRAGRQYSVRVRPAALVVYRRSPRADIRRSTQRSTPDA